MTRSLGVVLAELQYARQSVVLGGIIALGGVAAGGLLATSIVAGVVTLQPAGIPRLDDVRADMPVLLFAVALARGTGGFMVASVVVLVSIIL